MFSHGNNGNATAQLNETQTTADRSQFSSLEDARAKKSPPTIDLVRNSDEVMTVGCQHSLIQRKAQSRGAKAFVDFMLKSEEL